MVQRGGSGSQRGRFAYDVLIATALACVGLMFWHLRIIKPATEAFHVLANQDFFTQIYPMSYRAAAWLRGGVLPLWNPFQYCGVPFMATGIYGVLYPFNFPYLILPTHIAIEVVVLMHLIAAGCFMYAYARVIHLSRLAAILAAVTFMLSGFVTAQAAWFPPAIACAAWLPLALIGVEQIFARRRFSWAILVGLATAMPALSGWPQTWVYTMYVLGGYAGCRLVLLLMRPAERPHFVGITTLLAGGVLLGVLLPAAQLLPTLELQSLGPRRAGGLTMEQALVLGPVPPGKLLREAVDARPGRARLAYVGMLNLILMPLALCAPRGRKRVLFLLVLGILSICVSLTVFTPVFQLYRLLLPGGTWFRAAPRILFLYAFAAAALAGISLNGITAGRTASRGRREWIVAIVAGAVGLGWLLLVEMPPLSRWYLCIGIALLAGVALAPGRVLRALLASALVALVTWDLFCAMLNPYKHPYHDPSVFDGEQAAFDFIKRHQGLDRTYIHAFFAPPDIMAKQGTLREIYSVGDYEPLSLNRYDQFFHLIEPETGHRPDVMTFTGFLQADPAAPGFRFLDLMSVRYILVRGADLLYRQALAHASLRPVFESPNNGAVVYENPYVMPRAYVVHNTLPVRTEADALRTLSRLDARRAVVLEGTAGSLPEPLTSAGPMTEAHFVRYAPNRVILETDDPAPGYLVLTDTFYPGWKAYVDSKPTIIYPANFIVRAVPVAAGRHTVTFVYDPLSVQVGMALSVAAMLGIAVYAALGVFGRWRSGAPRGNVG